MKTAMQELIEQLELTIPEIRNGNAIDKLYWIEKEKQQIIDAYKCSSWMSETAKQYYKETFKND